MRAGPVSAGPCALATLATGGAGQTTAKPPRAGLPIASRKITANRIRINRERSAAPRRLFVGEVFKFRSQLADPAPVIQAPDEATIALVPGYVQELFLCDQGAQPGQVRIGSVADASRVR